MTPASQRLHALLAVGRVAEWPTIATQVGVAFLLSHFRFAVPFGAGDLRGISFPDFIALEYATLIFLALLFHLGGCLLCHASDVQRNAHSAPELLPPRSILRPGPSALAGYVLIFSAWLVSCVSPTLLVISLVEATWADVVTFTRSGMILSIVPHVHLVATTLLAISVIAFAKLHKRWARFSPLLMATCHVLLITWVAIAVGTTKLFGPTVYLSAPILAYAGGVFLYTLAIRLITKPPSWPLVATFTLSPLLLLGWLVAGSDWHASTLSPLIALAGASFLFLAWSVGSLRRHKHTASALVPALTAGSCLLDACFGALISWQLSAACMGLFLVTLFTLHLIGTRISIIDPSPEI